VTLKKTIRTATSFGLIVLLFGLLFFGFFGHEKVLLTTDALIAKSNLSFSGAIHHLVPGWRSFSLLGSPRGGSISAATFFKGLFQEGITWNNLIYGLAGLFTSFVFVAYLLRQKISQCSLLLGVITACWVGSNFTLLYAGHAHKPFIIFFFILSLLAANRAGLGSVGSALVWGSCVGLMFAQQPDVAMFFALFAGAHLVFRLWKELGCKPLKWLKVLILAALVALLFAAGPLLGGYKSQVKGTAQMQTGNPQAKWDYVTQWSFPPEETIAFIAPGYTGWRSGEPDGPYWGRMGRSAGWEQTRQGFQNFKLENTYLGVIPVAFALFALFSCRRSKHRVEIIFWSCATLVALLLAFGKFFPLYSFFYKLPVVNNIRNPNKFLQVFQVCLAILTAYGVDALFSQKSKVESRKSEDLIPDACLVTPDAKRFFWVLTAGLGILVLCALSVSMSRTAGISEFMALGWPQDAARVIVQNKITALWHASFMAAVVTAVFAIFSFPRLGKTLKFRNWIAAGLVLIVSADAVKLSKHYVKEMPRSYIEANALTDFLKKDLGHQRVALLSQQGIYNVWISYLLPYNRITTFNFAQMGRMPQDYQQFLDAGSKNPLRMWRFAGVKYLLGPSEVEKQLPAGQLRKVFAYDLAPGEGDNFQVVPSPLGTHAVFEFVDPIPRYVLIRSMDTQTDDQEALVRIADSRQPLLGDQRAPGSVAVLSYRPGEIELKVQAEEPSVLRAAERWDSDWKAELDGEPVEVQRIDFICQGIAVPAGTHQIVLTYSPSRTFFYMQCAGYIVLFAALLFAGLRKREAA